MNIHLRERWNRLSVREQCLFAFGGALLVAAFAYQAIWSPAVAARNQLLGDLPRMRTQLARMVQQASEARALKANASVPPPSGQALLDSLKASLVQRGLPNADLSQVGNAVRLNVQGARFSRCITWLDQVRRDDKLQVSQLQAAASGHPGEVNLTATLQGPPQ